MVRRAPTASVATLGFKREQSVILRGRKVSVELQPEDWQALRDVQSAEGITLEEICDAVAERKPPQVSLSTAVRVFLSSYQRSRAAMPPEPAPEERTFAVGPRRVNVGAAVSALRNRRRGAA